MTSLKSEVTKLGTAVTTLKTEVTGMMNEMMQMKQQITETISTSVQLAKESCLGESFSRFATMLDIEKRVLSAPEEGKLVEEHTHINDEEDLINFNKILANKQVFEEYVSCKVLHMF